MSISGVNKSNFKVSLSPEIAKDLKLSDGEIIEGRVLSVSGDKAVVLLKGRAVSADLNLNLAENQKFFVQVMGKLNGKIILQLVQPKMQGSVPAPELEALKHFGFPVDADFTEVAKALVDNNLPLNKRNIEWLYNNFLRFNRETSVSFLAYLLGREIPVSEYIVSALALVGNNRLKLHQLLLRVKDRINGLTKTLSDAKNKEFACCLDGLERMLENLLQGNSLDGDSSTELADNIKNSLDKIGYGYEYIIKQDIVRNGFEFKDERISNMLKGKLIECLEQFNDGAAWLPTSLKDVVSLLQYDLINLVKLIDGQQILNAQHSNDIEKIDYYTFTVPLNFVDNNTTLQVKIVHDGIRKKGKIDPDNLRMVLHLETQNLGLVNIDVLIRQKRIFCRFGVGKNLLDAFQVSLKEFESFFSKTHYRLAGMQVMASEELSESANFAKPGIVELSKRQELDLKL